MKSAWAITSGEYSDYRVLAIFETKEQAEAAIHAPANDVWQNADDIQEIVYYPKGDAPKLLTTYERMAEVWDDGTFTRLRDSRRVEWEYAPLYERPTRRPSVRFIRAPVHKGRGGRLEVRGLDAKAVDKAYSDNLARLRVTAEQTGKATL